MDEAAFRRTLADLTQQSQRFLEATALARDQAYQSMLEQALRVFTRRVSELLDAERASLSSWIVVAASSSCASRRTSRRATACAFTRPAASRARRDLGAAGAGGRCLPGSRFNRDVDLRTGFRTRSGAVPAAARPVGRSLCGHAAAHRRDGHRSTPRTKSATRISRRRSACCSSRWSKWIAARRPEASRRPLDVVEPPACAALGERDSAT